MRRRCVSAAANERLMRGAGAARHRRFHDDRVPGIRRCGGGNRVDHLMDGREIGVSGVRRRCAHCDKEQACVRQRVGEVRGEVQAARELAQELREPRLIQRGFAGEQARDPLLVDVHAPHLGAELREPRGRHLADVARADHSDGLPLRHNGRRLAVGPQPREPSESARERRRNTGCFDAASCSSCSDESARTPSKNTPTSHAQRRR